MKKKMSLINLSNNEVKKKDLRAATGGSDSMKGHFTAGSQGLMAAPGYCSAWCSCTCPISTAYSLFDSRGRTGAIIDSWSPAIAK